MRAYSYSHIGAVRKNNEDSLFCDEQHGLFIVADGIGGRLAGEVASSTAVDIAVKAVESEPEETAQIILKQAFYEANDALYKGGKESAHLGMGSTMTAAIVRGDLITWAHVGDSRAYLINQEGLHQLTEDHSLVGELVREGTISADEAEHHPQRNILIRSLGQEPLVKVDSGSTPWQAGDYLLLCSDGFYGMVDKEEIVRLVLAEGELKQKVELMIEAALAGGGMDNISVVLVRYEDGVDK